MSLSITDTTYAGEAAYPFIVKALTGNETVQGGHIYVQDQIKKTYTIPRLSVSNLVQAYAAEPTSQGTMTVDGNALNPEKFMLYHEFNPKDFHEHWYAGQLTGNMLDEALPQTLESAILQEHMKYFDNYMNKAIWQARTTLTNEYRFFNGLIYKALADSTVIDVATPTTLTAGNIEAELQTIEDTVLASIPDLLYNNDAKYYCSYKTANLWEQAQFASSYKGSNNTERGVLRFHGREIVPIKGILDDTVVFAVGKSDRSSNLWLGINDMADMEIKIGRKNNYGDLWFIKMLFQADVQFGFGSEVALYTTAS